jgi:hypothetical protein
MTKYIPIVIGMLPEDRSALEAAAQAEYRSISSMVRIIIAAWLREKKETSDGDA